jgi:hypothetical protein
MDEIFKSFSNYGNIAILDECCTTDKCKEGKCYNNCLECGSSPFCFTTPQLPCVVPKAIRKIICLKGKIIETFLNQAFCTILEAIRTGDFSPLVLPGGIQMLIVDFTNQQNIYSSFSNPPTPFEVNFLLLSAFIRNENNDCDGSNKIKLKFLANTGYNPLQSSQALQINQMANLNSSLYAYGLGFTAPSESVSNSGGNPQINSYGAVLTSV